MVYKIVFLVFKNSKEGVPPSCKTKKQTVRYITAFSKHHKTWARTTHQILLKKKKKEKVLAALQDCLLFFLILMKGLIYSFTNVPYLLPPVKKKYQK